MRRYVTCYIIVVYCGHSTTWMPFAGLDTFGYFRCQPWAFVTTWTPQQFSFRISSALTRFHEATHSYPYGTGAKEACHYFLNVPWHRRGLADARIFVPFWQCWKPVLAGELCFAWHKRPLGRCILKGYRLLHGKAVLSSLRNHWGTEVHWYNTRSRKSSVWPSQPIHRWSFFTFQNMNVWTCENWMRQSMKMKMHVRLCSYWPPANPATCGLTRSTARGTWSFVPLYKDGWVEGYGSLFVLPRNQLEGSAKNSTRLRFLAIFFQAP